MRYLIVFLLIAIFIHIGMIGDTLKQILEENSFRVTEVHHHYEYDVESYGIIKLNDKLVDMVIK